MTTTSTPRVQTSVTKTDKKLAALFPNWAPAPSSRSCQIHAGVEKNEDGSKEYSYTKLELLDYSIRGETKRASYNLSATQLRMIADALHGGREAFEMTGDKIFGTPNDEGRSFVNKLVIRRTAKGSKGEVRKLPWYINIDNGSGIPMKTDSGGTFCQSGSFKSTSSIYINLSDEMMCDLIYPAVRFLEVWELTTYLNLTAGD